jgi:hypothetical protein
MSPEERASRVVLLLRMAEVRKLAAEAAQVLQKTNCE